MAERFASVSEDELCKKCIIKQLLNSVFAYPICNQKYGRSGYLIYDQNSGKPYLLRLHILNWPTQGSSPRGDSS